LKVPEWKWEEIGMDFIVGLPRTQRWYDSIWVIVDRLTKVAHFIPVKTTYTRHQLAKPYILRIVCLHGVPKKIVSDRGTQFTSKFWERQHESMETKLNSVQLITLKPTNKWNDSTKSLKTCWELVLCNMAEALTGVYPMLSSHITIVFRKVWRWHHSRCYMVEDAELLYFGMILESDKVLDPTLYKTLRRKSG
jgi:hypothetical protein